MTCDLFDQIVNPGLMFYSIKNYLEFLANVMYTFTWSVRIFYLGRNEKYFKWGN
jgi:hypothetical protein